MVPILSTIAVALFSAAPLSNARVLEKRFTGIATWYNTNTTSVCTQPSPNFITVALSPSEFGDPDGKNACNKVVLILGEGRKAQANVLDVCNSCGPGDIDMSPELFKYFAPLDTGKIDVMWDFLF